MFKEKLELKTDIEVVAENTRHIINAYWEHHRNKMPASVFMGIELLNSLKAQGTIKERPRAKKRGSRGYAPHTFVKHPEIEVYSFGEVHTEYKSKFLPKNPSSDLVILSRKGWKRSFKDPDYFNVNQDRNSFMQAVHM